MAIIKLTDISKSYKVGEQEVFALKNVNLEIEEGKFVVILGPSGAGKSTLLNLLGGLDTPTCGSIVVDKIDISKLSSNDLADYRANKVGFIFQFYNLIPTLTVYENVALINEISKQHLDAKLVLKEVGLEKHLNKFPSEISGGEQQRVSIARAIAKNPKVLLCDEPTGALDSKTGVVILKLLLKLSKSYGKTIVIVTHNQNIAKMADVIIHVKNGQIKDLETQVKPMDIDEVDW